MECIAHEVCIISSTSHESNPTTDSSPITADMDTTIRVKATGTYLRDTIPASGIASQTWDKI